MANVRFVRAPETNIINHPYTDNQYDGAFLLTNDTNKLYTVQNNDLKIVNAGITQVSNLRDLPQITNAILGQFYYIEDTNVLCRAAEVESEDPGTLLRWIQINAPQSDDYALAQLSTSFTNNSGTVNITLIGKNAKTDGDDGYDTSTINTYEPVETNFNLIGGNGISVTTDGSNNITIDGTTLNAMTYMGTITSLTDLPITNNAHTGDTYYVSGGFDTYEHGDLFIRNTTDYTIQPPVDTDETRLLLYDYVPAGDDAVPTYEVLVSKTDRSFAIQASGADEAIMGGLTFGNSFTTNIINGKTLTVDLAWESL